MNISVERVARHGTSRHSFGQVQQPFATSQGKTMFNVEQQRAHRARISLRCFVVLALCGALACGSDATVSEPTPASLVGTWALHDINGIVLPAVIGQTATTKIEMMSDVVTATAAGTYSIVAQLRTTTNGQVTLSSESDAGTYTLTGNAVVIHSDNGSTINGTVKGNTFTVASGGIAYEFRKQ
jgi:hypothetical protein